MAFNLVMLLICTVLLIPLHELGHYILAKLFGWNPKFGMNRKGFFVRYTPCETNRKELKLYLTGFFGIIGAIPTTIYVAMFDLGAFFILLFLYGYTCYELWLKRKYIKKERIINA